MEQLQDFLTNGQGIALLDGGQATHLESLGHDLSGPLWSATLLATAAPRTTKSKVIQSLHDDYALAGADMVGTLTYQLSNKACQTAGIRQPESTSSQNQDEYIDGQVREWFHRAIDAAVIPGDFYNLEEHKITSVCLGPYGAALANGAEYTGEYPDVAFEDLVSFHLHRLRQAASSPGFFAMKVLAFETIPRLDEAEAICEALNVFMSEYTSSPKRYGNSPPPAYFSFVFPPEAKGKLPWPANQTSVDDIVKCITKRKKEISWPIAGIGINCTKPWIMEEVVPKLTEAVRRQREADAEAGDKLQLFLYPDGGEVWDAINRVWRTPQGQSDSSSIDTSSESRESRWAKQLFNLATAQYETGLWQGIWIGGCCKSGTKEIEELKKLQMDRKTSLTTEEGE